MVFKLSNISLVSTLSGMRVSFFLSSSVNLDGSADMSILVVTVIYGISGAPMSEAIKSTNAASHPSRWLFI